MRINNVRGMFTVGIAITASLMTANATFAQARFESLTQDMREREYSDIRERLVAAVDQMPADKYNFKAAPEIRGFGEEVNHAADVNFRLCGLISANSPAEARNQPSRPPHGTDKASTVSRFMQSLELCDAALEALTDEDALTPTFGRFVKGSHAIAMLGHNSNVYGKLTIMMRLNGIAPGADGP